MFWSLPMAMGRFWSAVSTGRLGVRAQRYGFPPAQFQAPTIRADLRSPDKSPSLRVEGLKSSAFARATPLAHVESVMDDEQKPPPWWFVPALLGGMAGAVALAVMVIGSTQ